MDVALLTMIIFPKTNYKKKKENSKETIFILFFGSDKD